MESEAVSRVLWRILLLSSLINSNVCGQSMCAYTYTIQPPEDIVCNPYINKIMQLECAIRGSNLAQIQWYFSPSNIMNIFMSDTIEIINNTKYSLAVISADSLLTSRLTVSNLMEESDTGLYWCRGSLDDGTMLQTPSSSLELKDKDEYPSISCLVDIFLKSSTMKCITFPLPTDPPTDPQANGTISGATATDREVSDYGVLVTMTSSMTPQLPSLFNNTLIVITTLVTLLLILCVILTVVIGTQCKRRLKAKGYHESTGQYLRSTSQSTDSHIERKASSGEYAEIGPAIMASVNHHLADNPHYSHINDTLIKQSESLSCSSYAPIDPAEGCHIVENPYDAPISPKDADRSVTETELDKCYSRLDRVVPVALVQPSPDVSCSPIVSGYIEPMRNLELSASSDMETPPSPEEEQDAPKEHPYHILEGPKDEELPMERWSSYSDTHVPTEVVSGRDGPVERSSTGGSCQTTENGKIYDVSKSPYDCLESQDMTAVNYSNLEQYLNPITPQKPSPYADGTTISHSEDTFKYSGDYERDPIYMEKLHQANGKTSPFHYQALVRATINPAEDYTKLQVL